jgi:hypothetical protein
VQVSPATPARIPIKWSTFRFPKLAHFSVPVDRPYGTDYEWKLVVRTKNGHFVREHGDVRYNPGSSWQTPTYTYGGSGAYCVEFRVRNHATNGWIGSGSDCT